MKLILTILFVSLLVPAFAQQADKEALNLSMMVFDRALEKRDTISLKRLLSNEVTYGHSNGWVENKKEVIADLYNGIIGYDRIVTSQPEIKIAGKVAQVRSTAEIWATLNGEKGYYKLKVLQVWLWENGHWTLFARQSAPMKMES
ncbi:nuclear transport factor 2 family protein [Nemorincola caseinilytica]|uniref:Nuclear transport factor 2 family protein n=1 Tax=Nemorincola caseinilytica TaxID=2054315 RepID=A0ABP8NFE5_9BACT